MLRHDYAVRSSLKKAALEQDRHNLNASWQSIWSIDPIQWQGQKVQAKVGYADKIEISFSLLGLIAQNYAYFLTSPLPVTLTIQRVHKPAWPTCVLTSGNTCQQRTHFSPSAAETFTRKPARSVLSPCSAYG